MKILRSVAGHIPGFRKMRADSMVIAATYYGAALFMLFQFWYWGLAMLALPFFVFGLVDLKATKDRRGRLTAALCAGALVLASTAGGLAVGGVPASAGNPVMPPLPSAALTTPVAPAALEVSTEQFAFVAARGGKVFHKPDCADVKRISGENTVGYRTRSEALAEGLTPCMHCKP